MCVLLPGYALLDAYLLVTCMHVHSTGLYAMQVCAEVCRHGGHLPTDLMLPEEKGCLASHSQCTKIVQPGSVVSAG